MITKSMGDIMVLYRIITVVSITTKCLKVQNSMVTDKKITSI